MIRSGWVWATAALKEGEPNGLLQLLADTGAFPMSLEEMEAALDPKAYVGRCPEQVEAFLSSVRPILGETRKSDAEINV